MDYGNHRYWSGFIGGEAAGSHFPIWENNDLSLEFIKSKFIEKNRYVKSINLTSKPEYNFDSLLSGDEYHIKNLSRYEKIDFFNRQTKYIAPHIMPKGFDIIAPFASKEWMEFICSIPQKYRVNIYMYENILLEIFPKLFGLPTKNKLGLSLDATKMEYFLKRFEYKFFSMTGFNKKRETKIKNYFDFGYKIRNDKNLKSIVLDNIYDLKKRKITAWIDFAKIIDSHLNGTADHADALQVLSSLEINLKAKESTK